MSEQAVERWDPFPEMDEQQLRFNSVCQFLPVRRDRRAEFTTTSWTPDLQMVQDDEKVLIRVKLAGVNVDDVHVLAGPGGITLIGERRAGAASTGDTVAMAYRSFVRRISLPDGSKASDVEAEFNNGVLKIRIAKRAEEHDTDLQAA